MLTLYVDSRHLSPWAMTVYVSLQEKALDFDVVGVDIDAGEQHRDAYVRLSPMRRVPLLVDDGFALAESTAICEYLEARYPAPAIYPAGLQPRSRAREIQAWIRSDLAALRATRPTEVLFESAAPEALGKAARNDADKLVAGATRLLAGPSGHLFDDWSIVDADLALMLQRIAAGGDPLPPLLARYVERQWSRPSLVRWRARGQASRELLDRR